jgi:RNA polymerase sigma-70 factor (ECF subfamily)
VVPNQDFRPGSHEDFEELYRQSYRRIVGTLMGVLDGDLAAAEDCAQETFTQAYRAWPRWRPDAPAEAWVHRIALNVASSHRRRERLREVGELVRRLGRPALGPDPADRSVGSVTAALRRLPTDQAALIVLRHHHGYSNREIATAMGIPETTLGSRLQKAMKRLHSELEGAGADVVTREAPRVIYRGKTQPGSEE